MKPNKDLLQPLINMYTHSLQSTHHPNKSLYSIYSTIANVPSETANEELMSWLKPSFNLDTVSWNWHLAIVMVQDHGLMGIQLCGYSITP